VGGKITRKVEWESRENTNRSPSAKSQTDIPTKPTTPKGVHGKPRISQNPSETAGLPKE
jgi:hypothetical protein